jgi:DNA-binding transcriptional regulator YiaG
MTKKLVKKYNYEGLGFPIELNNVEMFLVNGEYAAKIDVRSIANKAIKDLILQQTKLTGNQVKFIRSYFSFSLRDFSKIVNESHTAVRKWETFKNKPTNMDPNIEARIRVYIYDRIFIKNKNDKLKFYDQYHAITEIVSQQKNRNIRPFYSGHLDS